MKKALIFNPYFDTLGGGERYCLSIVEYLIEKNYQVEIAWSNENIIKAIDNRFNIHLAGVAINKEAYRILTNKANLLNKILLTKNYDLIFYISDGSIPTLSGKCNWLLFQAPFINVGGRELGNQLKLKNINQVICYSNFVKKIIDKEYKINAAVIYPHIADIFFQSKPIKKDNIILSVGRFDQIMNAKKQDVLITVFKDLVKAGLKNWRLVLLGGLLDKPDFVTRLKTMSVGYPIDIYTNVPFKNLFDYYLKSKIYWHAAGFGEDLLTYPQKAEHFGLAVVEAMVCGAVPLVFKGGGLTEIISDNSLLWQTLPELAQKTKKAVADSTWRTNILHDIKKEAQKYNRDNFNRQLEKLF